jgi:hypothetical protein
METKPLTKAEKSWLKKLEKLLMNPPTNRIGFYTIGDSDLLAYDRTREDEVHDTMDENERSDFDWCVESLGASFGSISSACAIHSTAG